MKNKSNFIFLSLRKNLLPFIFCLFTICLVLFSKQNLAATKNGLLLWANSVVPSLLPFFIATELLSQTNVVSSLGILFNKFMKPIFNVPGVGAYAFLMGIISGYPIGAKIVTKFRKDGFCTKAEAERLLSFTNNSGPLFIIGTVGISLFGDTRIGLLLFITHLVSCIIVGFIFRFWKYNDSETSFSKKSLSPSSTYVGFSNLGEILSNSISNAIHSIFIIGGFVVLFCVIISILDSSGILTSFSNIIRPIFNLFGINSSFVKPTLSGIIELTNGLKQISNINTKSISINIIFSSFLLGFGGLSILLQVLSITSKSDISIKPYIIGKFLHGVIAAFLTYLIIYNSSFFNLDIVPTFSQNISNYGILSSYYKGYSIIALCFIILFTTFITIKRKRI